MTAVKSWSQVNIRVPPAVEDVLEAAAFVRRYRGMQELLGPIVSKYAEELAGDDAVRAAVAARKRGSAPTAPE